MTSNCWKKRCSIKREKRKKERKKATNYVERQAAGAHTQRPGISGNKRGQHRTAQGSSAVFSTGQSVRPEGGRRWTALSGPVPSFPKLARHPDATDYIVPPPSPVKNASCLAGR